MNPSLLTEFVSYVFDPVQGHISSGIQQASLKFFSVIEFNLFKRLHGICKRRYLDKSVFNVLNDSAAKPQAEGKPVTLSRGNLSK